MKEDFLHYIWQFKKFDFSNLETVQGEKLILFNSGHYLQLAGPDFFNSQLSIGEQKWAGNVEIHLKSSDWYVHHHENDSNYDNVILHVVWEHDTEVFRKDNSEIPVLELRKYVSNQTLEKYLNLASLKSWIFCEKEIATIDDFVFKNWQEKLFFERLERKSIPIQKILQETENDWETVLFCLLGKSFGLNTNGEIFFKIAQSIPFSIIRKESFEVENLEALFFGRSGLLDSDNEDSYKEKLSNISLNKEKDKLESWKEWLLFFFKGISFESKRHIETAKAIIDLYKEMTGVVGKTEYIPIIDELFNKLKVEPKVLVQDLGISDNSVRRVLKKLSEENNYITRHGTDRKTIYYFNKLVDIIE